MGKVTVFILLFVIVASLSILVVYVIYSDDSANDILDTRDILVRATDVVTQKPLEINFTLMSNNTKLLEGTTRLDSYETFRISADIYDSSVLDFFITDPEYYTDKQALIGDKLNIDVFPIGHMTVVHSGELTQAEEEIKVFVNTDYMNRQLSFCVKWSTNIIEVWNTEYSEVLLLDNEFLCVTNNKEWIEETIECSFSCKLGLSIENITAAHCDINYLDVLPPERLKTKVDRCYYAKKSISVEEPFSFTLLYKNYITLNERDWIKVYILDSNNDIYDTFKFEDSQYRDWGAPDIEYVIPYIK